MVVALRAAHGEAHPHGPQRGRAIQHLLIAELFGVCAALAIGEGVAIESGGHQGIEIAIGQQIAGELLDGELVKGNVAIERVDYPFAIAPGPGARAIFFVAVAIRVARQVKPVARPLLAVVGRIQQAVHQAFIGVGTVVAEILADLLGGGREAGKIETHAAEQGQFRGFRRGRDAFPFQAGQNKAVHRVVAPGAVAYGGRGGPLDFLERPVRGARGPVETLIDPRAQHTHLFRAEVGAHRRHEFLVETGHQADQTALGALAGENVHTGGAALQRGFLLVQPQAAHLLLRAVADQAALSQQRLDIADEFNLDLRRGRQRDVSGAKR